MPPLGLGYIASTLIRAGHDVSILDACSAGIRIDEVVQRLSDDTVDLIAISIMTPYAEIGFETVRQLKNKCSTPVLLGGPHVTSFTTETIENCPHADYLIIGEGELPTLALLEALAGKIPLSDVPGLVYKRANGTFTNGAAPAVNKNITALPFPARSLFNTKLYSPLPNQFRRLPATSMISSRGCPYARCTFCFQSLPSAPRYRRRSPINVVDEMECLVKEHGYREISFWDDNFAVNEQWILEFCGELKKRELAVIWSCYGHADTVTFTMLEAMATAGCYHIYYGIESGNESTLKLVCKHSDLRSIRDAVSWAKLLGMEVRASFILGFPEESPEMTMNTIRFATELDLDYVVFFPFRPYPGTLAYQHALRNGRLIQYDPSKLHQVAYLPNNYQSPQQLLSMVKTAYRKFYWRPSYWWKILKKIKNFSEARKFLLGFILFLDISNSFD